ncbi:hypothetical protein VOLCADRAFT_108000 [Volvox carteri f. nagariensis]|uniref:EXPERA domain-containing protein n=1 Tax=Volvox carteri f. nagariensis TaxID=3068 RepID=D8UHN3_VOLCA|nr:uncharacterized protein VOLCADRAFT_108000 [Volvox carteri f. nagariensis]EFJ40779.1 hypothetical protein VOLCADRAFT_108000 [Volvox carteri f. nagariensis]|eukprot:XP_002958154.1 hypothetical protein VOLCADRAFT_108000 [Volvox carteri f. nagariensis]
MGLLTSVLDRIFLAYFILHIPTTVIVDSQSVVPAQYFPSWAKELLQWHIKTNGDHLVSSNPLWFVSLVACEILLQLPFFFVASYAFLKRRNWIRIPCIVYGSHVATTMVPILSEFLFSPEAGPKRLTLVSIYLPYLVVPVLLVVRMAVVERPFGSTAAGKRSKKNKAQ